MILQLCQKNVFVPISKQSFNLTIAKILSSMYGYRIESFFDYFMMASSLHCWMQLLYEHFLMKHKKKTIKLPNVYTMMCVKNRKQLLVYVLLLCQQYFKIISIFFCSSMFYKNKWIVQKYFYIIFI